MKVIIILLIFVCVSILVYFHDKIKMSAKNFYFLIFNKYECLIKTSLTRINLMEIIKIEVLFFSVAIIFSLFLKQPLIFLFFLPVFFVLPKIYITYKQKKYIKQYYNSLVDFLESIISNLKSGLSIIKSFQVYSQMDKGPAGNEISVVLKNVEFGKTLQESLSELSERIPLRENQIIIFAIINSIETGGNITEILENVLETIRKRGELNREIKALTSQGILSGLIVGLLPLLLVFVLLFIDPYFINPLFTTTIGNILLIVAVSMEIIGAFFIKKIVDIR